MALRSLRFQKPSSGDLQSLDKPTQFWGDPHEFHTWEWKVTILAGSIEKGKEHKIMNEIVKGLNGDALQTAMDFSVDELVVPKGIEKLVDAMRLMVFPSKKSEAKELYRAGHKQNGMLSRQKGESMMSYISRRR